MKQVLFLKEYSSVYEEKFQRNGFEVYFAPVFSSVEYRDAIQLKKLLCTDAIYNSVIISSKRAVDAIVNAVDSNCDYIHSSWIDEVTYYVVGSKAANALKSYLNIKHIKGGSTCKSSVELLSLIHANSNERLTGDTSNSSNGTWLYLCGVSHLDQIPDKFEAFNIPLKKMCVYHLPAVTGVDISKIVLDHNKGKLKAVRNSVTSTKNTSAIGTITSTSVSINNNGGTSDTLKSLWIVYFSPRGVQIADTMYVIRILFSIPTKLLASIPFDYKVVSIGPTTATALTERDVNIDVTSTEPSSDGILFSINQSINQSINKSINK